jgi:hypothetical protein
MVMRMESSGKLEEIEGFVESVESESNTVGSAQYHLVIRPTNVEVKGKTGRFHEWVPMSKTATEETVPHGSVMERYLTHMEIAVPAVKKAATIKAAFNLLVGKKFRFQRMKLGRDYDGNPAREYLVPVAQM